MKGIIKIVLFLLPVILPVSLAAQKPDSTLRDTARIILPPLLDSTYVGKNIFDILSSRSESGATVTIIQSENIKSAFAAHIEKSSKRQIQGYRIRIYFDNSQVARNMSAEIVSKFTQSYPTIPVYRTYSKPYFKVTVGDFRSKSEAMRLMAELEQKFSSAFLVKEIINYPPL